MKIRIAPDWWECYIREQPGKTRAEKESHAERIFEMPGREWAHTMGGLRGKWVIVETKYLFEDQFNIETARVMAKHISGISFSPEFSSFTEFKKAVQIIYDVDWPGHVCKFAILNHYIKMGFIKIKRRRQYVSRSSKNSRRNR